MKVLAIGDVTGPGGIAHLEDNLYRVIREEQIDFCIVNAENASFINGVSREGAEALLLAGADVISGGNHTMRGPRIYEKLDEESRILRPINFGEGAPGHGASVIDTGKYRVLSINAMGCVHIEPPLDSPYAYIERALAAHSGEYDFAVLDIHAEATGEKLALAHYFDGRINVIFGTHTHVPTADGAILPKGTGYITDLGMCGESGGILGMEPESVIYKMKTHMPGKFRPATGRVEADGVIFTLDDKTKRATSVRRIKF